MMQLGNLKIAHVFSLHGLNTAYFISDSVKMDVPFSVCGEICVQVKRTGEKRKACIIETRHDVTPILKVG